MDAAEYQEACESLWRQIESIADCEEGERILVIGTEEFMFPALFVATRMEEKGCCVRCHSTTRSPIAVSSDQGYPLGTRYELRSLYDPDRITYLYDIGSYDSVYVITDAWGSEEAGRNSPNLRMICYVLGIYHNPFSKNCQPFPPKKSKNLLLPTP